MPAEIALRKRRLELTVWAFILSLSFYPGPWGFLAWLALVRPLMIIAPLVTRKAFTAGYFFSFLFNAFSLYWVAVVTPPGMIAAVVIVSLYYTVVLVCFNRLYAYRPWLAAIAVPFLWTGLEYFRTLSEFAFPWSDLGYTQSYFIYIIQFVSVVSVHGLTLVIVAVNVLLWQLLRKEISAEKRLTSLLVSVATVLLLIGSGWIMVPKYPAPGTNAGALLQGSVPIDEKWKPGNAQHSFDIYDSLTQSEVDSQASLFVWPETAAPCYLTHDQDCQATVADIAKRSGGYHLIGSLAARSAGREIYHYNSCFQFSSEGKPAGEYDKVKLVPFSEQVPYQDQLWFLRRDALSEYLTFIKTYQVQWWSDFRPGDSLKIFSHPDFEYGVLLCFESAFPEYTRQMVQQGSHFIVGITNDTWFGRSVGIHMHSRIFLTRMIENRCWGVRVANSGLTYIVDDYGRIRAELPIYEAAALTGKVKLLSGFSIFTRFGDIAGKLSLLILTLTILILVVLWLFRKIYRLKSSSA